MLEAKIIAITDLGAGNAGSVSAAGLPSIRREELTTALTYPEYRRKPTDRFRCIDGRFPEGGLETDEGYTDPGIAGGEAVTDAAASFMLDDEVTVSQAVTTSVTAILGQGRPVVVHGDNNKGESGCGAAVQLATGAVFVANAVNQRVVTEKSWAIAGLVGLHDQLSEIDVAKMIDRGARKAKMDGKIDMTAEELVQEARRLGAEYEELLDEHHEKAIELEVGDNVLDRAALTRDFQTQDGKPIEAFVASIKAYRDTKFADFKAQGKTEVEAAKHVLAAIIFNVGVSKQLTAEEQGSGEALPVVIVE